MHQLFEILLRCIQFSDQCAPGVQEPALRLARKVVGIASGAGDSEAVRHAQGQSQGRGEPDAVSLRNVDRPYPVPGAESGSDAVAALFLINQGPPTARLRG